MNNTYYYLRTRFYDAARYTPRTVTRTSGVSICHELFPEEYKPLKVKRIL